MTGYLEIRNPDTATGSVFKNNSAAMIQLGN
jgi:hypothetical protein